MSYPYNIYANAAHEGNAHSASCQPHLLWTLLAIALWWLAVSVQSILTHTHASDLATYIRTIAEGLATILAWTVVWSAAELQRKQTPSWRLHALVGAELVLACQLATGLPLAWLLYAMDWNYNSWWPTAIEIVLYTIAIIATARFVWQVRGKRYQLVAAPAMVLALAGLYGAADWFDQDLPPKVVSNVLPANVWAVTGTVDVQEAIDLLTKSNTGNP
jgi:hypothetical protein